ncbi:MAG: 50S ribosomal protein L32 [Anaerolineales bacterium]|nr:50S ribosomal protein L32 [Anaerolineales bacterium]
MGALPKRKISKARRDRRRTHDNLTTPTLITVREGVEEIRLPHRLRRALKTAKGRKMLGLDEE